MTQRYKITKPAADDLKAIWRYTFDRHGEDQADKYLTALKAGCRKIADNPEGWRSLTLAGHDVRLYHCEHHYIVYTTTGIRGAKVAILAFLHERMNIMARLQDRLT